MSRKSVVPGYKMIDAGDISGNLTSSIVSTKNLDNASIHLVWSGASPVGVITIEARHSDKDTWFTVDMGVAIDITGNSGDHQIVFSQVPFSDIRLQYTSTSGTGSLDALILAKTEGA